MSDTMELHKGFFDRTGKRHYLSVNIADKIIANECGYCLVAYYQMRIGELLRAEKKYLVEVGGQDLTDYLSNEAMVSIEEMACEAAK